MPTSSSSAVLASVERKRRKTTEGGSECEGRRECAKEVNCAYIMKALKCKPSAQFTYNYTINVSSKCGNIISHRSSVFEGRHNAIDLRRSAHRSSIFESRHIDLRRSTHRSSIFEGRHIDLRRLKAETSHRQPNIAPTTQHRADIPTIRHRILSTTALHN